jgi:DNA-directed RNA polymerase specialized sigma24 family protein
MDRDAKPLGDSVRSVMREIELELGRLEQWERAAARERALLLSAHAALAGDAAGGPSRRRRVSRGEVTAYLAEHPGASPAEIAESLAVPATNVSTHLYRGRDTRYERREDGWHLRSHPTSGA